MRPARLLLLLLLAVATTATTASAQSLPDGLRYDDSFTWFAAMNRGEMRNSRPTHRYHLTAAARIFGTGIARNSAFRFVLKQGRRVLGEFTCQGTLLKHDPSAPSPDSFVTPRCVDRELSLTAISDITVEVHFVDDRDDSDHLAARHTITVRRLRQENHRGQEQPSEFFVDQYGFGAVAYLTERAQGFAPIFSTTQGRQAGQNRVVFAYQRAAGSTEGADNVRCRVDDSPIDMGTLPLESSAALNRTVAASEIMRAGNSTEPDRMQFVWEQITLPITFGESGNGRAQNAPRLEDHAGAWRCELRDRQRRVLREIRFRVEGGHILAHAEEASLSLPPRTHLAEMTIPSDSPIDPRTNPVLAGRGAFYGRGWQSDEGRAMARRVPRIGQAYPRSTQPRARRR